MKTFVCVLLLAAAAAAQDPAAINAAPAPANAAPAAAANPNLPPGVPNYGPKFFGSGIRENPLRPPHPLLLSAAQRFAVNNDILFRVDNNGKITPVDIFGKPRPDVKLNAFGDFEIDREEAFELRLEELEEEQELLEEHALLSRIQARQNAQLGIGQPSGFAPAQPAAFAQL